MNSSSIVVLDIGGTKINFGRYRDGQIEVNQVVNFDAHASAQEIFAFIVTCIDKVKMADTQAIAIGVPCILDLEKGVVFDAVNIPAWQAYPLKDALVEHYAIEVYLNNDVNCFVAGEYAGRADAGLHDMVGICLGTGFGCGIVLNGQLYAGHNCSAGEVGGIPYLTGTIDDYCSGQFFLDHYGVSGMTLAQRAEQGDAQALAAFELFGQHLAKAITYLLFVLDPQLIVIGGSVAKSYHLFIDSVWQALKSYPYQGVVNKLNIIQSDVENAALHGAAALYLQEKEQLKEG